MATQDEERKASTASAPSSSLANEDDTAVLGTSFLMGNESMSDSEPSKAWVQARVAPEFHND